MNEAGVSLPLELGQLGTRFVMRSKLVAVSESSINEKVQENFRLQLF